MSRCLQTCCDQIFMQRYLSCKDLKTARTALLLSNLPELVLVFLCVGNGLALYAYFEHCDPLQNGELEKIDQLLPYLAVKIFRNIPGLAGLFVAASYSGTLSTVLSGINAMSAIVLHDFIIPCFPHMKQAAKYFASLLLSILFGILIMAMAFTLSLLDYNITALVISFGGILSGPMIGIFTMAAFMPWVNDKGAITGFIIAWLAVVGIGLGSMLRSDHFSPELNRGKLPLSTSLCGGSNFSNETYNISTTSAMSAVSTLLLSSAKENSSVGMYSSRRATVERVTQHSLEPSEDSLSSSFGTTLFSISPYLFGFAGWLVCLVIGNIVSLLSEQYDASRVDWKLFAPGVESFLHPRQSKNHEKSDECAADPTTLRIRTEAL